MNVKSFWLRVKALLKTTKTTQKTFAEYLGIPLRTLEFWIYRGIYPLVSDAYRMAKYFGVSVDYLITGKEKKTELKINAVRSLLKKADEKLQSI